MRCLLLTTRIHNRPIDLDTKRKSTRSCNSIPLNSFNILGVLFHLDKNNSDNIIITSPVIYSISCAVIGDLKLTFLVCEKKFDLDSAGEELVGSFHLSPLVGGF